MVEIEVQKACQGDCIWLRCVAEKSVNIVIDAGPSTFAAGFKNLIDKIAGNKERIDLLIFSHIDDDHIRGCIRYLQDEGKKIIDKVLKYDTLANRYNPRLADDVKNEFNKYTTKEELKEYFGVWFKYFIKYPVTYINATIDNTYGYIYPNQHYWYVYDTYDKRVVKANVVDYHFNKSTKFLRYTLVFYESVFPYLPGIGLISSIGFSTWIVLILSVYVKKKKYLIAYIPLYLSILICFISPANTYFRYAMPYIFSMPLILSIFLDIVKEKGKGKK